MGVPTIDLTTLVGRLRAARADFQSARPFPHVVLDEALGATVAAAVAAEFVTMDGAWKAYHHVNSRKRVASDLRAMGPTTRAVIEALRAPALLDVLAEVAGTGPLVADPELDGSGLHETLPGGHLSVHADHLTHTTRRAWVRELNLLWFVNDGWQDAWGGALELWDATSRARVHGIAPGFDRLVLFRTSATSWHGVPDPVVCPSGRSRKSVALYYFHDVGRPQPLRPTHYVPRPDDPWFRRALVVADRWAVAGYSWAKRVGIVDDARIARLLKWW